ncbi:uncharacterized protein LOC129875623 [Solanum dulcamara]|uniref:uncharacterized protein LOC129875623 n=1 Tax=Solanum dulcamara TaxID=45834 RepID=UPI0024852436|nr:uncharacterized protein LOC129875623 [Solanum dulcamara]
MNNKQNIEPHIQWQIKSGSCLFWWDNWLGVGHLAHFSANSCRLNNTQVSAFLTNGQWNVDLIIQEAPPQFVPNILATQFSYHPLHQDLPCWIPSANGEFSCSSTWEIIKDKRKKTMLNSCTWHKCIPFKCSFLVWRAIRGKLPTNEKLISFGRAPSQCYCCYKPSQDTINHTFVAGAFAHNVWRLFSDSLGINTDYTPLRNLYASKYGEKQSNLTRVKFSIIKDTYNLLTKAFPYMVWPNNWKDLVLLVEQCFHDTKVTPTCWLKPVALKVKLNTDGSSLGNPRNIGGGGLLRNAHGDLIFAYATPLGVGTNNQVEIKAAIFGLSWCLHLGYSQVNLEVDS